MIYNLRVTQARCRRVGREVATAPIADYKVTTLQRWSDVRTTARKLESEIRNLDSKGRWGEDWISADRFLIWFEIFEKACIGKGRFCHNLRHVMGKRIEGNLEWLDTRKHVSLKPGDLVVLGKSVKPDENLHVESCRVRSSPVEHPHERFKSHVMYTGSGPVHDNNGKRLAFDERVELVCKHFALLGKNDGVGFHNRGTSQRILEGDILRSNGQLACYHLQVRCPTPHSLKWSLLWLENNQMSSLFASALSVDYLHNTLSSSPPPIWQDASIVVAWWIMLYLGQNTQLQARALEGYQLYSSSESRT